MPEAFSRRRRSPVKEILQAPELLQLADADGPEGSDRFPYREPVTSVGDLLDAQTAAAMASAGAFLVPTLAAYDAIERRGEQIGMPAVSRHKNREVLESGQQAVELARAAGVSIGFGTDLMGLLEDEQLNGPRLQAEADGTWTALASATSVNAALIGRPDLGRVAEGCTADLLILGRNIRDDPSVVWSPDSQRTIVQDGRVIADSRAPR